LKHVAHAVTLVHVAHDSWHGVHTRSLVAVGAAASNSRAEQLRRLPIAMPCTNTHCSVASTAVPIKLNIATRSGTEPCGSDTTTGLSNVEKNAVSVVVSAVV